jgi:hypothetical protein
VILTGSRYLKYNRVLERVFLYSKKPWGEFTRNIRSQRPRGLHVGLRPLTCWDCGFESRRGRGCLSFVIVVCFQRSRRVADHSSRGVLPSVVCLSVIAEFHRGGLGPLGLQDMKKETKVLNAADVYIDRRLVIYRIH